MKTYRKIVRDGYIVCVAMGEFGEKISKEAYDAIRAIILSVPESPDGYVYQLKATTLEWELVEVPVDPEPPEDDSIEDKAEAFDILVGENG